MKILDPRGPFLPKYWTKIVFWWFLLSNFFDYLFLYIPVIDDDKQCLGLDENLQTAAIVLRTIFDVFYIIHMIFQFRTRFFNVPSASEIALRCSCTNFLIDVLAVLPLPQVFVLSIIPRMGGSRSSNTRSFLRWVVYFQLLPRTCLKQRLYKEAKIPSGMFTGAAWDGAAFGLINYMCLSHVTGATWYALSIDRGIMCWTKACGNRTECVNSFEYCDHSTGFKVFLNESCPIQTPNAALFDFGIYLDAFQSGVLGSLNFREKFFYCFWWGLQNLSSLGQNLKTTTYSDEILLAMFVFMYGLIYYSILSAEIQKFLRQRYKAMGLEERGVKMLEVEQWMSTRSLPASLRERIKQYEQYKWQKTRGVDEENLIRNLPKDLRRDIKRHLGLDRLMRVPVFQRMDEQLLDALCDRLEQVFYTEGSFVMQEGKPVDAMLFVMDGKLASSTTNGGSIGFFNMEYLERRDFGGEELLGWALDPHSSTKLPFSTRTVKALSKVEALVLKADDLKIVASESRWSHDKQLRHFFRYYSQQWRTWAACFIQAAWRRHRRKKLEESLRIIEENRLQDALARGGGSLPSLGAIIYVVRFAVNAIRAVRWNGSAQTPRLPERIFPTMIQKPAEPDFIAEDEETAAESDSTESGVAFEEGSKGKYAASSSEVPGLPVPARSHPKRSRAEDERYDKLSTQLEETKTKLEEVGLAIKKLTDDRLNVNDLYEEVMKTEGFDEPTLALAFDHLVENEKVAKAFIVKNARLRRVWLEGFLKTNA
ncbi:cyclic nucleotide-gated ion channel 1-like isoform X2 [Rhododendron vialii]|uniref:cyclic nucleotide-gated ion channel 1-like isoform X2 n=1 Tax=Rhododendron vialii TaxID=182163 RepID=UPI00265F5474|nr:cyclic nucleotide-gated ion channel 1-like isoform X2 [Rhododendron vialii]